LKTIKRKELSQKVADTLLLPIDDVDDIVYLYYKYVAQLLSSLDYAKVMVPSLGTFKVTKTYLERELKKDNGILEKEELSLNEYVKIIDYKDKIKKMEKLLAQVEEESLKKRTAKLERHGNNRSMES
jgi:nucleoid DNA-binding protein